MRQKIQEWQTQSTGFSLLELLLSIGIISLIILMATRYFVTARNAQLVSAAVLQIQGVRAGISSMIAQGVTTPSIDLLCRSGGLPSSYCDSSSTTNTLISPWSTTGNSKDLVTISNNATDLFTLTYYFPIGPACQATLNAFTQDLDTPGTTSTCDATTGKGVFVFKQ